MFPQDLTVRAGPYRAYLCRWQDKVWRLSVQHESWGANSVILETRFPLDETELAKDTAVQCMRADIQRRDFAKHGHDRLAQLERQITALREQVERLTERLAGEQPSRCRGCGADENYQFRRASTEPGMDVISCKSCGLLTEIPSDEDG